MAFGRQNEQTTRSLHGFFIGLVLCLDAGAHLVGVQVRVGGDRLHHLEFDVAAQFDIGATARHVGGDGHSPQLARVGNDLGFLFMLARVQHVMRNACRLQHHRQRLGFVNRGGADQNRLTRGVGLLNGLHHAFELFARGAIHRVVFVFAHHRAVGRHFDHAQLVNFHEFIGFGAGRAGHAAQLVIKPEVVLEGHGCQRDVFRLNRHALLGLDRLMQAIRQAAALHHPAGEFVDQHHLAVADNILLVTGEQLVRPQRLRDVVHDGGAFRFIQTLIDRQNASLVQGLFDELVTVLRIGDVAGLFVQLEVRFVQKRDQLIDLLI
ncbi:MAG: hypothetical protein ACD_54C01125G0003 [uncultured bacterium]|nr:MAG: hypothetical protein ACD_54C01125G0003 [uncultured bacterium]